ncbi:MAG TPA: methyltransferase domain-containing protein [Candidatus Saccharimonadales bacterium]|nr:methyltransferase domain-containing protein [Candidatus Saccharimonadales bacterium]
MFTNKNKDKKLLAEYYNKKAHEYEEVYNIKDKKRLEEQELIKKYIEESFINRYVLELACGTGYWTKSLLNTTQKVIAIDQSSEMLTIASKRYANKPNISFLQEDIYTPPTSFPKFSGCMANFLFSHIPKKDITKFLQTLHTRLETNAFVFFVDSNYQEGQGGTLVKKKGNEDTWKRRNLNNGEEYDVLKNYYSQKELEEIFGKYSRKLLVQYLTNFWIVGYYLEK